MVRSSKMRGEKVGDRLGRKNHQNGNCNRKKRFSDGRGVEKGYVLVFCWVDKTVVEILVHPQTKEYCRVLRGKCVVKLHSLICNFRLQVTTKRWNGKEIDLIDLNELWLSRESQCGMYKLFHGIDNVVWFLSSIYIKCNFCFFLVRLILI